jgi:MFS family permease
MSGYVAVLLNIFIMRFAHFLIAPYFFLHLAAEGGDNFFLAGVLFGAMSLSAGLLGPLGGIIADRLGYRASVSVALLATTFCFFLIGRSSSEVALTMLCIGVGLSRALFEPASQALLVQLAPDHLKQMSFSHRYIVINVGAALGPLLGIFIAGAGFISVFDASALMIVIFSLSIFLIKDVKPETIGNKNYMNLIDIIKIVVSRKDVSFILMASILSYIFFSQLLSTLAVIVSKEPGGSTLYAQLLTANAVIVISLQSLVGRLSLRQGTRQSFIQGALLFVLACASILIFEGTPRYFLFIVFFSLGEMFIFPTVSVVFSKLSKDGNHATFQGIASLSSLGGAIGPLLGSAILDQMGASALFYGLALVAAASGILFSAGSTGSKAVPQPAGADRA